MKQQMKQQSDEGEDLDDEPIVSVSMWTDMAITQQATTSLSDDRIGNKKEYNIIVAIEAARTKSLNQAPSVVMVVVVIINQRPLVRPIGCHRRQTSIIVVLPHLDCDRMMWEETKQWLCESLESGDGCEETMGVLLPPSEWRVEGGGHISFLAAGFN